MNGRKPGCSPALPTTDDAVTHRVAGLTDNTPTRRNPVPPQHVVEDGAQAGGRSHRMPRTKELKWLDHYRQLGYTFERNSHLKVRDPEGLLAVVISATPSTRGSHRTAQAQLRRHERYRKAASASPESWPA